MKAIILFLAISISMTLSAQTVTGKFTSSGTTLSNGSESVSFAMGTPIVLSESSIIVDEASTQTTLSINEVEVLTLSVYPNPAVSYITVDLDIETVEIYNNNGQLVYTGNDSKIDVSVLSEGIYAIRAFSNNTIYQNKFVKL